MKFKVRNENAPKPAPSRELFLTEHAGGVRLMVQEANDRGVERVGVLDILSDGSIKLIAGNGTLLREHGFQTHCHGAVRIVNGMWVTR